MENNVSREIKDSYKIKSLRQLQPKQDFLIKSGERAKKGSLKECLQKNKTEEIMDCEPNYTGREIKI